MRRIVLLLASAALAVLLASGVAWAATLAFAPAKGYPAGDSPRDVAAGDLDGDGDTDLAIANVAIDKVSVLIRHADGTFKAPRKYAAGDGPGQVVVGDLNGDGDLDLAVENGVDVSVLPNRGDGTFGAQRRYAAGPNGPEDLEVGDLDGDGDQDLVTANFGGRFTESGRRDYSIPGTVSVFKNRGDGTFAAARNFVAGDAFEPNGLDRSDLDGDGDLDLVVSRSTTRYDDGGVSLLLNNGDGTFGAQQRVGFNWGVYNVLANDLDGDGDNDLAATDPTSETIEVALNNGDGTFGDGGSYNLYAGDEPLYAGDEPPYLYEPGDLTEGDFDGDGDLDLATAISPSDKVAVLSNAGDGTFGGYETLHPDFGAGDSPGAITRARMNADRKPDLVVTNWPNKASVLLNTTQ